MSYGTTFDDFELESDLDIKPVKPLWVVDLENEDKLKEWLDNDWQNKKIRSQQRMRTYREHLALYKGIHYRSQETRTQDFRRDDGDRNVRNPKIVINHVYDMIESKTARMTRFKPGIAVIPSNEDWSDRVNTDVGRKLITSRWYEVNIDEIFRCHQRDAYVFGDGWLKVYWDKHEGPLHPAYQEAKEKGIEPVMVGEDGSEITDEEGNTIKIKEDVHVGDVCYRVMDPACFYPEKKDYWQDVEHVTEVEYINIETLKAMYPEKELKISNRSAARFDPEGMQEVKLQDDIAVMTLWHRPTRFMKDGAKIVYTEDQVLEVTTFPYKHGKLPFIKLGDIDVPGELFSRSFIHVIKQAQRHFNNLASSVARNHGLASAPKWIMPKGACKVQSLNNDITVVEYAGPVPPQLVSSNPTGSEIFGYMDKLETYIQKLSAVHGVSRGAPPAGIKAGVALQFLDEQESERESNGVAKRHWVIKETARMTLSLMGQYYKDTDGRLIKVLGKDNGYEIESFKMADFSTGYDVRIQNASALPEGKSARTQAIIDLGQTFPSMFQPEQLVDLLDLGAVEKFASQATVAVKAAESENDSILSGKEVDAPAEWENLIIHYDIHLKKLQERQFKKTPPEIKQAFIRHLKATEMLMWMKINQNALFRQQVMARFPQFPVFFSVDKQTAMMLAGANMGQPGTGQPMPQDQGQGISVSAPPEASQSVQDVQDAESFQP